MIRLLLALSYASAVIVLLVVYFSADTAGKRPPGRMSLSDCASAWQADQTRDAAVAQKPAGTKETLFKDKSLATGVDAAPVLSGG